MGTRVVDVKSGKYISHEEHPTLIMDCGTAVQLSKGRLYYLPNNVIT